MDAVAYIDGFNLYYGALKGTNNKWLDLENLARALTPNKYNLIKVRYFTARVKPRPTHPTVHTDQLAYLNALRAACPLVETKFGHYLSHKTRAANANPPPATVEVIKTEEKGSDVNLAVHLLNDAFTIKPKAAILITNDSDIAEAIELTKKQGVKIYWFPPVNNHNRHPSKVLKDRVDVFRSIYPNTYGKCQLPNPVKSGKGSISKPADW